MSHDLTEPLYVEIVGAHLARTTLSFDGHGCRPDAVCWPDHAPGAQARAAVAEATGRRVLRIQAHRGVVTDTGDVVSGWVAYVADEAGDS